MFLLASLKSTLSVKSPVCNSEDPGRCRWLARGAGSAQSERAVEVEPGLIPCEAAIITTCSDWQEKVGMGCNRTAQSVWVQTMHMVSTAFSWSWIIIVNIILKAFSTILFHLHPLALSEKVFHLILVGFWLWLVPSQICPSNLMQVSD